MRGAVQRHYRSLSLYCICIYILRRPFVNSCDTIAHLSCDKKVKARSNGMTLYKKKTIIYVYAPLAVGEKPHIS